MKKTMLRFLFAVSVASAALAAGCQEHITQYRRFGGRLALPESFGCGAPLRWSSVINWKNCHAFKRHFDPATGKPITSNAERLDSLRPLRATIELRYMGTNLHGKEVECSKNTVQTDFEGYFNARLEACEEIEASPARLIARVFLKYEIVGTKAGDKEPKGTVRAVWRASEADDLFTLKEGETIQEALSEGFTQSFDDGTEIDYSVPMLAFEVPLDGAEESGNAANAPLTNVGTQVFLADSYIGEGEPLVTINEADPFGYMRNLVSGYNTILEYHERFRKVYKDAGREADYFDKAFVTHSTAGWEKSYTIYFDSTWAYGRSGSISLGRPDLKLFQQDGNKDGAADGSWGVAQRISGTETLGHEFGHSIHASLAPASFASHSGFSTLHTALDGVDYKGGHNRGHQLEMGMALVEGVASSISQYVFDQCTSWDPSLRPSGGVADFSKNYWSGDVSCDTEKQNSCSAHRFRNHMKVRGIVDGDMSYSQRLTALQALTAEVAAIQGRVTSNDEGNWQDFGCDLMDTVTDVSHAESTKGQQYGVNLTYGVGQILNGQSFSPVKRFYPSTLPSETTSLALPSFIDALADFCPGCNSLGKDTTLASYGTDRLQAVGGKLSPQRFVRYLVDKKQVSSSQAQVLLQSNWMEDQF